MEVFDDAANIPTEALQRIAVVGTSCSGKTTFSRQLATLLGLTHIELDSLFWTPNWVGRPVPEFCRLVEQEIATDSWITDGNFYFVRNIVWSRATTVIWLNYSFPIVFARAISRTVRRAWTQEEVFSSGNYESFRRAFLSTDSIPLWVVRTFWRNRRDYKALQKSDKWPHLSFIELQHPKQANAFLSGHG